MKEIIAAWAKRLEAEVAAERGKARFKDAVEVCEFVHVFGHDSSILEIVLNRGFGIYEPNVYTRIVWSEHNPPETPFLFKSYASADNQDKPKQEFHNDITADTFKPEYFTAAQVEERLELEPVIE
jgi:hypothetical protein